MFLSGINISNCPEYMEDDERSGHTRSHRTDENVF